eukprot:TRINITY_DN108096_c0_g1_i1.p2 TRINITY_DN108096_c0_g1~~TRINITY_DN108096_c0_g1_i1.p2  ORF type:complete len:105 (-),score=17.36 TRINITY_DN108096_c0_g1_i1:10-324(-)
MQNPRYQPLSPRLQSTDTPIPAIPVVYSYPTYAPPIYQPSTTYPQQPAQPSTSATYGYPGYTQVIMPSMTGQPVSTGSTPQPSAQIGRAVQQECRDRSRMPSSA